MRLAGRFSQCWEFRRGCVLALGLPLLAQRAREKWGTRVAWILTFLAPEIGKDEKDYGQGDGVEEDVDGGEDQAGGSGFDSGEANGFPGEIEDEDVQDPGNSREQGHAGVKMMTLAVWPKKPKTLRMPGMTRQKEKAVGPGRRRRV